MDAIDLKAFGRALQDAGLMEKSFLHMSGEEVHEVADLLRAFSKKHCLFCDQWLQVPDAPWWVGKCRIDGHELRNDSMCTISTDRIPF